MEYTKITPVIFNQDGERKTVKIAEALRIIEEREEAEKLFKKVLNQNEECD